MSYPRTLSVLCAGLGAAAAPACGGGQRPAGPPPLETRPVATRYLAAPSACGQGPYEIELSARGHRWGESIELAVHTPRDLKLRAELFVDGERERSADFGDRRDNRRCVIGVDEVVAAPGLSADGNPGEPSGGASPAGSPNGHDRAAGPDARRAALVATDAPAGGLARVILRYDADNPTLGEPEWDAGTRLRLRLWSTVPNDLEGVIFVVRHELHSPPAGEGAYIASLEAEQRRLAEARAEAEAEAERRRLEAEAEARRRRLEAQADAEAERRRRDGRVNTRRRPAPRPLSDAELAERRRRAAEERAARERDLAERRRERAERERRRQLKIRLRAQRAARRRAYCKRHLDDRDCWGPGGFRWLKVLRERAADRQRYCQRHPGDARCWDTAAWSKKREAWRADAEERRFRQPEGPPPEARAETQPPRPSDNAEWRPGYWHWGGREWSWIAGLWRVPQSDIEQELTARTPQEPPPPRAETPPPPPAAHAVWIAGAWHWDGATFVWVPGAWRLPPSTGVRWRASRWVRRGSLSVFLPGLWIGVSR